MTEEKTRTCIKCGDEFYGMAVMVFRIRNDKIRATKQLLCMACGTERYNANLLPEFDYAGSISHGTLNPYHLVDTFGNVLEKINPSAALAIWASPLDRNDNMSPHEIKQQTAQMLQEALEEAAPVGYYFGTLEGDGSDFGFWEIES